MLSSSSNNMMPLRLFKKCGTGSSKNLYQANSVNARAEMDAVDISFPESCSSHELLQSPEPDESMELISNGQHRSNYLHFDKTTMNGTTNQTNPKKPLLDITDILNEDQENEIKITGYRLVWFKWFLTMIAMVLSAGSLWLLLYWKEQWQLWFTHQKISLNLADTLLIEDEYKENYKRYYVKKIRILKSRCGAGGTLPKKDVFVMPKPNRPLEETNVSHLRYFVCKKETYLWDDLTKKFFQIRGLDEHIYCEQFYDQVGLSELEQIRKRLVYGLNDILVPNHSIGYLLATEVLNPFYIFQLASVILWTSDEYYYYAAAIVIMSVSGIVSSVYQTKQNEENLRSTIRCSSNVIVKRQGEDVDKFETISSSDLVPGDIIALPNGKFEMSCDAVLILGNVIVNEAMLTGESVPELKSPIPKIEGELYDARKHLKHTLLRGTEIIQTRSSNEHTHVLAVVIRTGFQTTKGNLVRSIMYPAPVDFEFEEDSYRFIGFLTAIAGAGFIYTCIRLINDGEETLDIFLDAADLITIVIPPALPAAMTIGSIYAQKRLKEKGIFCISPRTINVAGSIQCVCFDKTGTLTEDGLDMQGIVPVVIDVNKDSTQFQSMIIKEKTREISNFKKDHLTKAMATCHSLTIIDEKLSGDPIDLKMFEFTGWSLEEGNGQWQTSVKPPTEDHSADLTENLRKNTDQDILVLDDEIAIVKQFQFSSDHQSMSVIVRDLSSHTFKIFCKGSPEKMKMISNPKTIPDNFHTVLDQYTENGYRVIAVGMRDLASNFKATKIDKLARSEVEKDLVFLGLIVFENRIKKETKPIIEQLHNAKMRTIMVTGDHIQTALSVARECKMITCNNVIILKADHDDKPNYYCYLNNTVQPVEIISETKLTMDYTFATDGKSFNIIRDHFPIVFERLCTRGSVFARMTPDQKEFLIEELQELGYYVAMCGDGANDCGALKAAHAGISLSEAEASVASPFTSKQPNISCVPELIREGRAALVTSFGIFKYMAGYSLTQYASVIILYEIDSNLTDLQFLWIDLFLITVFAFFFGMTRAYEGELAKRPPNNSLIHFIPIMSIVLQLININLFQIFSLKLTLNQNEWFVPFNSSNPGYDNTIAEDDFINSTIEVKEEDNFACYENFTIFVISSFQYIILAYVFSKSKPYRRSVISNIGFMASLLILTGSTLYLSTYPATDFQWFLELFAIPDIQYRWILVGLAVANAFVSIILEDFVTEIGLQKFWNKYGFKKTFKYNQIEEWLRSNINEWPVLCKPKIQTKESVTTPKSSFPFTVEVIHDEACNPGDNMEQIRNFNFSLDSGESKRQHDQAATILNDISSADVR